MPIHNNLVIDIGNTFIKVGEFEQSQLVNTWQLESMDTLKTFLNTKPKSNLMFCSVSKDLESFVGELTHKKKNILTHSTPIPFENHYKSKQTLGLDRIAVMAGAEQLFDGRNCLVIDMGTCITYDLLDVSKCYYGGVISPGLNMRFQSMHQFTEKLPLITSFDMTSLVGDTTTSAMISGVVNGISAEIDGIIDQYRSKWADLQVIVCGGDGKCFESKIKEHIFAAPNLVLIGLNRILEYNEKN